MRADDVKRPVGRPRTVVLISKRDDPWDAAISRRAQEILDALEAPPIDKATRDMFCRWLHRRQKFPEIFRNEPLEVEEKIVLTCRAILESKGNENALIEPIVTAVSLCLRPQWVSRGVAWIEAFDQIPLVATLQTLVELFGAKEGPQHLRDVLRRKLWLIFGPDVPVVAKPRKAYPAPSSKRSRVERNVALGLDLLKLRSSIKSNLEYGRQVRRQFNIEEKLACQALQVAKAYGSRPEIVSRVSWAALVTLSSPTLPAATREALEARIAGGEKIDAPAVRAARAGLRRQRERMAA